MATRAAMAAETEEGELEKKFSSIISTLPRETSLVPSVLRKYQGFWYSDRFLPGAMAFQHRFRPRDTDVLLCSSFKCGTTWLKALCFAIARRTEYPPHDLRRHPLAHQSPHLCVPMADDLFGRGDHESQLDALPPPTLLATHMAYSLLPDSVKGSDCRIVYVCRDPKDALVSGWHFIQKMSPRAAAAAGPLPLGLFVDKFCEGVFPFGPVWEHVVEFWKESLRRPEKVLFLKYEDMLEDPGEAVRRLAEFVGQPFSPEEEERGVAEEIVRLCSFEKLSSLPGNNAGDRGFKHWEIKTSSYFRKGEAGDWKNHLTPEMAQKVDSITEEKFRGSGLGYYGSAGS